MFFSFHINNDVFYYNIFRNYLSRKKQKKSLIGFKPKS